MNGPARPRKYRMRTVAGRGRRLNDQLPTFAQTRALRTAFAKFQAKHGRKTGLKHAIRAENEAGLRRARMKRGPKGAPPRPRPKAKAAGWPACLLAFFSHAELTAVLALAQAAGQSLRAFVRARVLAG